MSATQILALTADVPRGRVLATPHRGKSTPARHRYTGEDPEYRDAKCYCAVRIQSQAGWGRARTPEPL